MLMMGMSAWIKFEAFHAAAIVMMGVLGAGLLYYTLTHVQWVSHVTGNTLKTKQHKVCLLSILCCRLQQILQLPTMVCRPV